MILCKGVGINGKFMYICGRLVNYREDLCVPWFHSRRGGCTPVGSLLLALLTRMMAQRGVTQAWHRRGRREALPRGLVVPVLASIPPLGEARCAHLL